MAKMKVEDIFSGDLSRVLTALDFLKHCLAALARHM